MKTRPLPAYLKRYFDKRIGKVCLYFRKRGHALVPLPQPIGSEAFWSTYNAALKTKVEVGAELRSIAGSVSASIAAYYASHQWGTLADGTRRSRRAILERFRNSYGDGALRQVTCGFIEAYLDLLTPHAARNTLVAMRGWLRHARRHDLLREIRAAPVKSVKHESCRPRPWLSLRRHMQSVPRRASHTRSRATPASHAAS